MVFKEGRLQEIEPQLKRMKFRGTYYERPGVSFVGVAAVDISTGQFVGIIEDAGFTSDIVGEKYDARICFVKLYRDKKINEHPINYEFQRTGEGWEGFFTYGVDGYDGDTGPSQLDAVSLEDSLISSSEYRQVTEEVSVLIGQRRGEIAERLRKIEQQEDHPED